MPVDRAYIPGGRVGAARAALAELNAGIMRGFAEAGCVEVEPAALLPADRLLDVYGEDLRARAFVVEEPSGVERLLRADFTAPVLDLHGSSDPARYAYLGTVWRRQPHGSNRPVEYLQAGMEIYGGDPAETDAEILIAMRDALAQGGIDAPVIVTGDLGLTIAILDATPMPETRRAALRRHFWRPRRFRDLLGRFAAPARAMPALADVAAEARRAGRQLGARGLDEVVEGWARRAADRAAGALPQMSADLLDHAFGVEGRSADALAELKTLTRDAGVDVAPALDRMARRLDALARHGLDADALPFRASTARTLEYYDGFVFEMSAPTHPDLPPLAGGGRYDGLAAALGAPPTSAVGGIVRPEALLAAGNTPC